MDINVMDSADEMAHAAAQQAATALRVAIEERGEARFIAATGNSQLSFLSYLVEAPGIDWAKTTMFHLDEYLGIDATHPASFVGYLKKRLVDRVPIGRRFFLDGVAPDIETHIAEVSRAIRSAPIDVACIGIGENGHVAFNDPPADFETEHPYIMVDLDQACRTQQVNEGWFPDIASVPSRAITMSVHQIMESRTIVCTVPDRRKAKAVHDCLSDQLDVSPERPASILRRHPACHVYLDKESASLL